MGGEETIEIGVGKRGESLPSHNLSSFFFLAPNGIAAHWPQLKGRLFFKLKWETNENYFALKKKILTNYGHIALIPVIRLIHCLLKNSCLIACLNLSLNSKTFQLPEKLGGRSFNGKCGGYLVMVVL